MIKHKIELVLRVDGEDVEALPFDTERAFVALERRSDGTVTAVIAVDDDGCRRRGSCARAPAIPARTRWFSSGYRSETAVTGV